ncbi:MAG TPA: shikimate dehydrogenase [Chthoniobacterales bacterium]|nr:shikimate dehydrogenase [Chthoniobacterales bacterium]
MNRSDLSEPPYLPPLPPNPIQVGLIGSGIQASRSPAIHLHEASVHRLRYSYELIDLDKLGVGPEALPSLLDDAERRGFTGLNVTYPCKQTVIPLLDDLSPEAEVLGAVNTVVFVNGRRTGHNTDWFGFAESFRRGLSGAKLRTVVQLGAGGAGAATAYAALTLGVNRLIVFDQEPARASALANRLSSPSAPQRIRPGTALAAALQEADGLIHATPTGMINHPGLPLPAHLIAPHLWIAEVVYFPLETELLKIARQAGCRTLNGGGMVVFQASEAFRLFTGITPDRDRMLTHFLTLTP